MSSGQGTKETHLAESCKAVGDVVIGSKPKKKRPRVRNRPRNKSNVLNAAAALANANSAPDTVPNLKNQPPQLHSDFNPKINTKPVVPRNQQEKLDIRRDHITDKVTKSNNESENSKPRTASQSLLCRSPTKTEEPNSNLSTPGPSGKTSTTSRLGCSVQNTAKPQTQNSTDVPQNSKTLPQAPINSHSLPKHHLRTANSESPSKSPSSSIKSVQSPTKLPGSPTRSHLNTTKPPSSPTKSLGSSVNSASSPSKTSQNIKKTSPSNVQFQNAPKSPGSAPKQLQSPTGPPRTAEQHSARSCQANKNQSMPPPTKLPAAAATSNPALGGGKTREEVIAEREAKKLAKQAKKTKSCDEVTAKGSKNIAVVDNTGTLAATTATTTAAALEPQAVDVICPSTTAADKAREQIKAEREAKKLAKQALKAAKAAGSGVPAVTEQLAALHISDNAAQNTPAKDAEAATTATSTVVAEDKKKPALSKAERRAIQEAQRAAKAQASTQKNTSTNIATVAVAGSTKKSLAPAAPTRTTTSPTKNTTSAPTSSSKNNCKVKLFNHLETARQDVSLYVNNPLMHPSISRLGEQYAKRTIVGSNARCIAFLNALKMVIQDFETPPKKEFARSLEATITHCVEHLQNCRPLAVSVSNAYKHIKHVLTQLPTDQPESELKNNLCRFIETYVENQIEKAAEAISCSMQKKISNGDVILTFGCSSLINYIFEEAQRRNVDFRVIVVDSRPFCEGQELLRRLTAKQIPCSYVLINAIGFIMPEATKVLLGAHALLANGYVMARTGTAQVALVAHSFNVPVLVCCETHKFSERFQTDAIVYNELGNPNDLILDDKCCLTNWQTKGKMSPLNLMYDITPSELVTAVVTEVAILPCTSVPVILRIKPTEIGYS